MVILSHLIRLFIHTPLGFFSCYLLWSCSIKVLERGYWVILTISFSLSSSFLFWITWFFHLVLFVFALFFIFHHLLSSMIWYGDWFSDFQCSIIFLVNIWKYIFLMKNSPMCIFYVAEKNLTRKKEEAHNLQINSNINKFFFYFFYN